MDFSNLTAFLDHMARHRTPGNAVEVYRGGEKVFSYQSGYADLENRLPLRGGEHYNIYSCSKVATVTAGMQLLERGQFLLSDPLYAYLEEYRDMTVQLPDGTLQKAARPILVGDLFTMTAGLTYNLDSPGIRAAREKTAGAMDTVTVARSLAQDPLSFHPGSRWQYSLCHDVLAALVSLISGKSFAAYMQENIFAPLGMHDTAYHPTQAMLQNMAQQYTFQPTADACPDAVEAQKYGSGNEGTFVNVGPGNRFILGPAYDSGGAGIITTVADYAKFLNALAMGGVGATGARILSPHGIDLLRTNRLNAAQLQDYNWKQLLGCGYGLGVRTHMDPAVSGLLCSRGEFGWGGAAGASAMVDPAQQLAVFYAQHTLNPREEYYQPRLRNVIYSCL